VAHVDDRLRARDETGGSCGAAAWEEGWWTRLSWDAVGGRDGKWSRWALDWEMRLRMTGIRGGRQYSRGYSKHLVKQQKQKYLREAAGRQIVQRNGGCRGDG
jgi:hypothetical protein